MKLQERLPEENQSDLATLISKYFDAAAAFGAARVRSDPEKHGGVLVSPVGDDPGDVLSLSRRRIDGGAAAGAAAFRARASRPHDQRSARSDFRQRRLSAVAAAAHGILGGIAFAVTGIAAPIFWGVMMGFFSLVPVVGSALIWVPAAISLMCRATWGGHRARDHLRGGRGPGRQRDPALGDQRARGDGRAGGFHLRARRNRGVRDVGSGAGADHRGDGASMLDLYAAGVRPGATVRHKWNHACAITRVLE